MAGTQKKSSNAGVIVMALVGIAIYAVATYIVTVQAGGTKIESTYSNTPNAVTSEPPPFK
jgi:hypothetical protein